MTNTNLTNTLKTLAARDLTGRVSLADVKALSADWPADVASILEMLDDGAVDLFHEDNSSLHTPAVKAAAIDIGGECYRHVLRLV